MANASKRKQIEKKRKSLASIDEELRALTKSHADATNPSFKEKNNKLREGETFATSSAPWVGAEKAWRHGIVPPPHEDWIHYKTKVDFENLPKLNDENLSLTDQEVATVLSSLPPPASRSGAGAKARLSTQLIKYAAVAVFAAGLTWTLSFAMHRPDNRLEPNPEIGKPRISPMSAALPKSQSAPAFDSAVEKRSEAAVAGEPAITSSNSFGEIPSFPKSEKSASTLTANPAEPPVVAAPSAPLSADEAAMAESAQDLQVAFTLNNPYELSSPKEAMIAKKATHVDELPNTPTRDAVEKVMQSIEPEVTKCKGARSGRLIMKVRVAGATGRVIDAETTSEEFKGSIEGLCAQRAIKLAQFPKFKENSLSVKYPFDI